MKVKIKIRRKKGGSGHELAELEKLYQEVGRACNRPSSSSNSEFRPALRMAQELLEKATQYDPKASIALKAQRLVERLELRVRGIIDLRDLGIGVWRGNEELDPTTFQVKGGEETMAKKKAATTTGRPVGVKSKVGIHDTWTKLFQENESRSKKWTDEEITAKMHAEFPDHVTKTFGHVQAARNKYNKGGFHGGVLPKVQSKQYDKKGNEVTPTRGRKKAEAPAKAKAASKKAAPAKAKVKIKKVKKA